MTAQAGTGAPRDSSHAGRAGSMRQDAESRIGIVVQSPRVASWQAAVIRSVIDGNHGSVAIWIAPDAGAGARRTGRGLLYRAFRLVERAPRDAGPDALEMTAVAGLVGRDSGVTLHAPRPPGGPSLADSVRSANLDVVVDLTDGALLEAHDPLARYGRWLYESGGALHSPADGSLAGFAEVLARKPCFSASLRLRPADKSPDLALFETVSACNSRSHHLTCNEHLWKCSTFVDRALRRLREAGPAAFLASLPRLPPVRLPQSRVSLARALALYAVRRVCRKLLAREPFERWIVLWRPAGARVEDSEPLEPPAGRFWADPHPVERDGAVDVFLEDASCDTGKGHIAVVTRAVDGRFSPATPVIERPYHLSYPFVFDWNGTYYMIPESADNATVSLYRCLRMPDRWEHVHDLIEGIRAYDATLVHHGGRWWMFANVAERAGASSWDELCLFHADDPLSRDWRPHRRNPVISDVRRARPAGPLYREGNRLIRPSQDSSGRYGRALNLNEVVELSEHAYREALIGRVEPDWDPSIVAVHSYAKAGPIAVIDAVRRESR